MEVKEEEKKEDKKYRVNLKKNKTSLLVKNLFCNDYWIIKIEEIFSFKILYFLFFEDLSVSSLKFYDRRVFHMLILIFKRTKVNGRKLEVCRSKKRFY